MAPPKRNADAELAIDCSDPKKIRPSEDIDHISQLLQNIEATVKLRNSEISLDSIKNLLVNCGKVLTDIKSKLAFEKSFQETERNRTFVIQNLPESIAKSASKRINEDTYLESKLLDKLNVKAIPESVYKLPAERNPKSDQPSKEQCETESNLESLDLRKQDMTDNFNFLGLPSVVQDLITNEIVHNSIPENRIQLALTSKYCNELVQHARPKRIIDLFTIQYFPHFTLISNSNEYIKTKEQLIEILPNCQIKQLQWEDGSVFSSEDYSEILDMLSEAARYATKLDIFDHNFYQIDKIVGFYVKLKHLKSVTLRAPKLILPYYPSKVKLNLGPFLGYDLPGNFLKDFAEKSQNCPLSSFELDSRISLEQCQQIFQTAKFATGAEICIRNGLERVPVYLTYLGQNTFSFEMFPFDFVPIFISQKYVAKNRRILKLKRSLVFCFEFTFNVISPSNPDKNYFSGVFKEDQQQMLINLENVDRDEILKVKCMDESFESRFFEVLVKLFVHPRYSAEMLESAFPTANFTTPEERVEKINNVLGTNIQLIQAENFAQTVEVVHKIRRSKSSAP